MSDRSKAFFKEANKKLETAKTELFKPAEDLVGYSVCKNSQLAIENYLKGYLVKNDIKIEVEDTIGTLYSKCVAFDKNFKQIDMSAIKCKNEAIDSKYCTDVNTLSACFDTADNIDTYLLKHKII